MYKLKNLPAGGSFFVRLAPFFRGAPSTLFSCTSSLLRVFLKNMVGTVVFLLKILEATVILNKVRKTRSFFTLIF